MVAACMRGYFHGRDSRLGQRKDRATPALRLGCLRELHYPPVGQAIGICLEGIVSKARGQPILERDEPQLAESKKSGISAGLVSSPESRARA